jgi:hypothetical protein
MDAVCLALTALWQASVTTAQVVDGPQATGDAASEWLFVGADGGEPDEGAEIATSEQDWMAFAKTQQETPDVTCAVVVRRGDTDIPSARGSAYAILAAADAALRTDPTLSGLVMQSHISSHRYMPAQTTKGAKVRITFTVNYLAQL